MRIIFFIAIIFLYACGSTVVKYATPDAKIDTIYAEYIIDTVWGSSLKTKAWRVTKDTIVSKEDKKVIVTDTSYYIPQLRRLVDSLSHQVKTKDGKDSLIPVPIFIPKFLIKKDFGDFHKYLYGK